MSAKEVSISAESESLEERHTQEGHSPSEASGKPKAQDGTNGTGEPANGEGSQKSEPATGAPSAESNAEPKVHVSAHERDREEQASRRVQEAQKYNNRDKGGRGGHRGGRGGFRNNNRFDPSRQEKSDDPVAIRKQVIFSILQGMGFVLSIFNLGRILFLRQQPTDRQIPLRKG